MNELKENHPYRWGSNLLWTRIAWIAGIFSVLICVLLIANYIQYKKSDPVNMTVINSLVQRLDQNPADNELREQIRTLDLLSRKAYFTSQWQIRTGGLLLLAAVALVIISMQIIEYRKKINPTLSSTEEELMGQRQKARQWIIAGGGLLLAVSLGFAFISSNDLSKNLNSRIAQSIRASDTPEAEVAEDISEEVMQDTASNIVAADTAAVAEKLVVSTDNFPNFRGNGGAGIVSKSNIPTQWDGASGKNIKWKTAVPLSGFSSPVVWGDNIFLTGSNGTKNEVYCFDRITGKILWTVAVGKPGSHKPEVSPETGYSAPTAATDGNAVYAIFTTGDIVAVDMTGKKIWERSLGIPRNHYGHSSSLLVYNGNVIVQYDQTGSAKIMALSAKTGQTTWSTDRPVKVSWASPIIVNTGKRAELLLVAEPYVASYNPTNGKELWKIDCIGGEVGPSLAYANGIAFAVNEYSQLCAVKLGDQPSILWESTDYLSDIPSPVATDKYLFMATSYGTVLCYDAVTGEKYWEEDFGTGIYASPMLVKGNIYLLDRSGKMHIFKADKEFKRVSESKLGEKSACTPAFTNGRIYIRGDKNLYCIGE
jgi:outer membrane protein assembly factor BamB